VGWRGTYGVVYDQIKTGKERGGYLRKRSRLTLCERGGVNVRGEVLFTAAAVQGKNGSNVTKRKSNKWVGRTARSFDVGEPGGKEIPEGGNLSLNNNNWGRGLNLPFHCEAFLQKKSSEFRRGHD